MPAWLHHAHHQCHRHMALVMFMMQPKKCMAHAHSIVPDPDTWRSVTHIPHFQLIQHSHAFPCFLNGTDDELMVKWTKVATPWMEVCINTVSNQLLYVCSRAVATVHGDMALGWCDVVL